MSANPGLRITWQGGAGQEEPRRDSADDETEQEDDTTSNDEAMDKAQTIRQSFSRPKPWMLAAGFVLAACAGIVNVTAWEGLDKSFVSHLTGALSKAAMELEGVPQEDVRAGDPQSPMEHGLVILSFVAGAFLCGVLIDKNTVHFGGKAFYGVALIGNAMLLLAATMTAPQRVAVYLAAAACGLQNAMCTSHFGAVVRTTHVTGSFTDMGSTGGRIVAILLRRQFGIKNKHVDSAELWVDGWKLSILMLIASGFFLGCFFGAFTFMHAGIYTFLIPASISGCMGLAELSFSRLADGLAQRYEDKQFKQDIEQVEKHLEKAAQVIRRKRRRDENDLAADDGTRSVRSSTSAVDVEQQLEHCIDIVREFARLEAAGLSRRNTM